MLSSRKEEKMTNTATKAQAPARRASAKKAIKASLTIAIAIAMLLAVVAIVLVNPADPTVSGGADIPLTDLAQSYEG